MAFADTYPVSYNIVVENKVLEQVSDFNYLGCGLTYKVIRINDKR